MLALKSLMNSEMPCREGMSTAGFEIALKGLCLDKSFKGDIRLDLPRHKFGSVLHLSGIVLCEAITKIGSAADVALIGVGETAKDVDVVHGKLLLGVSVGVFLVELVLICSLFLWP